MRWFVLCKGSAEGQEFKWYAVNSGGSLTPEIPEVCNTINGLIDFNSSKSSIALVRGGSSRLTLFVTKLVSTNQCDFASRAIYAHLVAESESVSDDDKLQLLAADLLDSKKINIDEFIHPSGETKESGAVVDRVKLSNELGDYWNTLLKKEIKTKTEEFKSELKEAINKIVFETAKLAEPLRDRTLFDNQLNQRLDFFCELLNPESKCGDNRRNQFISVVDDLVNFLEIGFIVDGQKLYALTTSSETLNVNVVMEDRGIAKRSDDKKIDLANQLRTLGLPKTAGVLIIVTNNISIATFEKMPANVCRVLCNGAKEGWHHLSFKQTETPTDDKKKELENSTGSSGSTSQQFWQPILEPTFYEKFPKPIKIAGKTIAGSFLMAGEIYGGVSSFGGTSIATGGAAGLAGAALVKSAYNDFKSDNSNSSNESIEEHPPES
jgi:hypothetical protein